MIQGNPDMSTDIIHLSRSISRESDEIDGKNTFEQPFTPTFLYHQK